MIWYYLGSPGGPHGLGARHRDAADRRQLLGGDAGGRTHPPPAIPYLVCTCMYITSGLLYYVML